MSSPGAPEAQAREFATRFGRRAFEDALDCLDEDGPERLVESYPDEFRNGSLDAEDVLEAYWRGLYGQYGEFEGVGSVSGEAGAVAVELRFADGRETASVEVGDSGVSCLSFSPEYETPDYVDRTTFFEREVTLDAEEATLNGVFAMPEGEGPFPGVVLVHGHGIHDPDGTVGSTRILRDLAQGLASAGIASLRYEKRLHEHQVDGANYTLDTVVTDDAVVAASALTDADEVDHEGVFVVGHSQGGMCAPRIVDRHGDLAGAVLLDPPADPVVDPDDLEWLRYSIEVDGELSETQEQELASMGESFRRIADRDINPEETVLGKPGAWHLSHHDCTPIATASSLDVPVFVAKAGRIDPELQPELYDARQQEVERWDGADFSAGSRTVFYEAVGHYFQDGPTPVTPTSLYFGGNVAEYVVADIDEWIHNAVDA